MKTLVFWLVVLSCSSIYCADKDLDAPTAKADTPKTFEERLNIQDEPNSSIDSQDDIASEGEQTEVIYDDPQGRQSISPAELSGFIAPILRRRQTV